MSTLLVLKFDTVDGAAHMRDRMLALQKQQLITVEDAAIMSKDANGKPKLEQLHNLAGAGALGGAFWGMLFGLLFFVPILGLAVGAAAGAIAASMADVGIDDKFIKQVGESITPGTSALFLLTSHAVLDKVLEQTKDFKYEILQSNLSQEDEDRLRGAISAVAGGASMESVLADSATADTTASTDTAPANSMAADANTADSTSPDSVPSDMTPSADIAPEAPSPEGTSPVEGASADTNAVNSAAADTTSTDNTEQS